MLPIVTVGQDEPQKNKKDNKKSKDEKKLEKEVAKYEEALAKATEKYARDNRFRTMVDNEFRRLRGEHARSAFKYNTYDQEDTATTHSGDRIPKDADTLYDNIMAQDYVNRVGQSLVPANSTKRYAFKIVIFPMPSARSLSTGTVYVSTGLLSMVDNEAQLAYVLAHEIAHVEEDHWREDVLVAKWVEEEIRSNETKAAVAGGIIGVFTGGIGGIFGKGGFSQAVGMGVLGAAIGSQIAKLADRNIVEWSNVQEDESDRLAMRYMLDRKYDIREVRTFFDTVAKAAADDPRLEIEFYAGKERLNARTAFLGGLVAAANPQLLAAAVIGSVNLREKTRVPSNKSLDINRNSELTSKRLTRNQQGMSAELRAKLDNGEILAGDGEFENIMATLRRDNGITAFYYDMFDIAARNLGESIAIKGEDPVSHYFYGRVMKLTARKPGERAQALQSFARAIELDKRNVHPQSRLYYALSKMGGRETNNVPEIVGDLKNYVTMYQEHYGGSLPPNMDVIYDYLQEAGETNWTAPPFTAIRVVQDGKPSGSGNAPSQQGTSPENPVKTTTVTVPGRRK
jgi:hypothetical protein